MCFFANRSMINVNNRLIHYLSIDVNVLCVFFFNG